METYNIVAFETSRLVTVKYSTSFSKSSQLFDDSIKNHIYNIYGFVRLVDEIVDTYRGANSKDLLNNLETETKYALKSGYSTNLQIHAFSMTARQFGIKLELINPFFESMRMDLEDIKFDEKLYKKYIYGSAEVVGLMCLRVFCNGQNKLYSRLEKGAKHLGSAYQKVNFLRDLSSDYHHLKRWYFPQSQFESFNESDKKIIIEDIKKDFKVARRYIEQLPINSKYAVSLSYLYYFKLLEKLDKTTLDVIKSQRISVPRFTKIFLYIGQLSKKQFKL